MWFYGLSTEQCINICDKNQAQIVWSFKIQRTVQGGLALRVKYKK